MAAVHGSNQGSHSFDQSRPPRSSSLAHQTRAGSYTNGQHHIDTTAEDDHLAAALSYGQGAFDGADEIAEGSSNIGSSLPSLYPHQPQFDATKSITPPEDNVEDDIDSRRPKKRKSVANLRGTASAQASSSKGAVDDDDGDDDDGDKSNRRKINIEYIEEKSKRHITFSKRKAGIMKKAYELSTLTGTQVLLLVVSESGWVYTFTTDKFKPLVKEDEHGNLSQGQKLIAACLENREGTAHPSDSQFHPPSDPSFEANAPVRGGQVALKPSTRGGPPGRPMATNRRVSGKGARPNIPAAIRTGSSDQGLPPLPSPMNGYLDPPGGMASPISPRGPHSRSVSGGPISPRNAGYSQLQQQQQQHHRQGSNGGQQEWAQMMEMQQQQQQQQQYDGSYDNLYPGGPPSQGLPLLPMHDQMGQQQQQHPNDRYLPLEQSHYGPGPNQGGGHYTHHPDPNGSSQQQQQQQRMYHGGANQQQSNQSLPHALYAQDDSAYASR